MLTIISNQNKKSNFNKANNIKFGTNLIIGQGVAEHLKTEPEESKKIEGFKEFLAKDGKDWNAELTYDTFAVSKEETEALIRKHSEDWDYHQIENINDKISKMNPKEASELILKLLKDPNQEIKNEGTGLIGKINDSQMAMDLIEKTINDKNNESIKYNILYSAGDIKDSKIRNNFIEKLSNSKDIETKRIAAELLHDVDDQKIYDKILTQLSEDSDMRTKNRAINSISHLTEENYAKNPSLYDSIIEKGTKNSSSRIRNSAAYSAGKLSNPQKAAALINEMIKDEDESTRRAAASSVGDIKDKQILKATFINLLELPDRQVKEGLSGAIMKKDMPNDVFEEIIEKMIDSKDTDTKRQGAEGVSRLKDSQKAEKLIEKLMQDPDSETREYCAAGFSNLKDSKLQEKLIKKYATTSDISIKKGLLGAIENIESKDTEKAKGFAKILTNDEDKSVKKEAKEILVRIKEQEQSSHYNLKITDNDKVVGKKIVSENRWGKFNVFNALKNTYESIFNNTEK